MRIRSTKIGVLIAVLILGSPVAMLANSSVMAVNSQGQPVNISLIIENGESSVHRAKWQPYNITEPIQIYTVDLNHNGDRVRGLEGQPDNAASSWGWRLSASDVASLGPYSHISFVCRSHPAVPIEFAIVDTAGRRWVYPNAVQPTHNMVALPDVVAGQTPQYFEWVVRQKPPDDWVLYLGRIILHGRIGEPILAGSVVPAPAKGITSQATDVTPPDIESVLVDNAPILPDTFLPNQFAITAQAADPSPNASGIASYNISLRGGQASQIIASGDLGGVTDSVVITANVSSPIADGAYQLVVSVADGEGLMTESVSPTFNIASDLRVTQLLNGPNPFNPATQATQIQYHLSQPADVSIYIYTIGGERVWHHSILSGTPNGGAQGFNAVMWDGRRSNGEVVSNGMYVAYLSVRSAVGKTVQKLRLMVLQ